MGDICECRDPDDPDLCAQHPFYIDACKVQFSDDDLPTVIQDELFWGYGVRDVRRKKAEAKGIPPKKSPFEFPFEICRAMQIPCKKKKKRMKFICPAIPKKITLQDKFIMSQQEYCNYLAQPVMKPPCEAWRPVKRKRCEIEPCPPRFVQLAIPHKRRVFWNWKCYHTILTTEMILRLEQILHTDKNLDPRDARWYYKKLDKMKRKCLRKRRQMRTKKLKERESGDEKWLEDNIHATARAIVDFLRDEPLFSLNYKQLMLSEAILTKLDEKQILKKPKRNTKNHYKRTLVEVSDKVAVWMDTITKFVDMQAIEDEDDIPPLTISSLGEEEESAESSYAGEAMFAEEEGFGEGEEGFFDEWGFLDELIRIYMTRTPDDYMHSDVGPMPWIKYIDILDAMIWLRDELKAKGPPPPPGILEQAMIDWLREVCPDKINDKTLKQIHDYACAIADKLRKQGWPEEEIAKFFEPGEERFVPPMEPRKEELPPPIAEEAAPEAEEEAFVYEEFVGEEEDFGLYKIKDVESGPMILGHVPSFIKEHSPDSICCLSLKIWAVWLLEVCHNAHTWTKWMHEVIRQIREFAATVRGEIKLPNGQTKVLYKEEWRRFIKETEEKIIYWMDYSAHVKELSDSIIENFKGKPVYCCPKCLQDHLIKNVVTAHETLKALTDAMNMAQYWRKCLDSLVATTAALTDLDELESSSEESEASTIEIEEVELLPRTISVSAEEADRTDYSESYGGKTDRDDDDDDSSSEGSYRLMEMDPRIQKPDCDCI